MRGGCIWRLLIIALMTARNWRWFTPLAIFCNSCAAQTQPSVLTAARIHHQLVKPANSASQLNLLRAKLKASFGGARQNCTSSGMLRARRGPAAGEVWKLFHSERVLLPKWANLKGSGSVESV